MPWIGGAIAGGLGLLGSSMAANSAENAGASAAAGSIEAAKIAADAAKFRPVGITTRFGTSNFTIDPNTGYVTGAGYNVSPDIAAIRDRLISQAGGFNTDLGAATAGFAPAAQNLFGLGAKYLATSPEQATADYTARMEAALAPQRAQTLAGIRNNLVQTGRTGLATGGDAGMLAANPELAAYYNSLAQQDLNIASQAKQQAQGDVTYGAGLFGTGANILGLTPSLQTQYLSPLTAYTGAAGTLEQMGQSPLDIGAQLGGKTATAGATAANALLTGGITGTQQNLAGTLAGQGIMANTAAGLMGSLNKQVSSGGTSPFGGVGSWLSGLFSSPSAGASPFAGVSGYSNPYGTPY
jgi:hypothetical protein